MCLNTYVAFYFTRIVTIFQHSAVLFFTTISLYFNTYFRKNLTIPMGIALVLNVLSCNNIELFCSQNPDRKQDSIYCFIFSDYLLPLIIAFVQNSKDRCLKGGFQMAIFVLYEVVFWLSINISLQMLPNSEENSQHFWLLITFICMNFIIMIINDIIHLQWIYCDIRDECFFHVSEKKKLRVFWLFEMFLRFSFVFQIVSIVFFIGNTFVAHRNTEHDIMFNAEHLYHRINNSNALFSGTI